MFRLFVENSTLTLCRSALHLKRKLAEAELHLPRVTASLKMLETAIKEGYNDDSLTVWREEEKEWMEQVVVVEKKKELSNPYDLSPLSGVWTCTYLM